MRDVVSEGHRMLTGLHPQLQTIAGKFRAAQVRLHRLVETVPDERWVERAAPGRWSAAECVAHLNLTAIAYREPVRVALAEGAAERTPGRRYRRGLAGWLLWRTMGPPVRFRVKTAAPFIPEAASPISEVVEEFDRLQLEQLEWVHAANGLAIDRLYIVSPFNPRLRYNLYAALSILPPHQHRHLWQAERVLQALSSTSLAPVTP